MFIEPVEGWKERATTATNLLTNGICTTKDKRGRKDCERVLVKKRSLDGVEEGLVHVNRIMLHFKSSCGTSPPSLLATPKNPRSFEVPKKERKVVIPHELLKEARDRHE